MKNKGEKHTNNNERTKLILFTLDNYKAKNLYAAGALGLLTMLMLVSAKKTDFNEPVDTDIVAEYSNDIETDEKTDNTDIVDDENQVEDNNDSVYYTDCGYFHIKHDGNKNSLEKHHYSDYIYNEETGKDEAKCLECGHIITKKHVSEESITEASNSSTVAKKDDNKSNNASTGSSSSEKTNINDASSTSTSNSNSNHNNNNSSNHDAGDKDKDKDKDQDKPKPPKPPVHEHSWSNWQYYNDSQEVSECSSCHEKKYQSHSYGSYSYNKARGLEEATCSSCGHVITRSHTHQFSSWISDNDTTHSRVCTVNGDDTKETQNHSYSLISQSGSGDTYQCSTCGHTMTLPHSHSYGSVNTRKLSTESDCYQTYQVCSGCGDEIVIETKHTHNYGSPSTYEEGGITYETYTCDDCGYSYQGEHGHTPVYVDRIEDADDDDICYRVYMHCDVDGCDMHEDILKEEVAHDYQHFTEPIDGGTYEYDECMHCHDVKNEVEILDTGARINSLKLYRLLDYMFDDRMLAKEDKNIQKVLKI